MNLLRATALVLILSATAAIAQSKPPTVGEALSMLQAFRNLDGRPVVVKQNGVDATVVTPWEFGSGTLRLRIARNVSALAQIEKFVEETRQKIIAEILRGMSAGKDGQAPQIMPGSPEFDNFTKQITDMLAHPAQVTLSRIKASELRLDKNEIPVTSLSALEPILDE